MRRDCIQPNSTELEEILSYAEELLGSDFCGFKESGSLPQHMNLGGRTWGDLRDARSAEWDRQGIVLYRPSVEEVAEHHAWHDYCSEHGYPTGDLCEADKAPGSKYPPRPERFDEGAWVGLKWSSVRKQLRGEGAADQLDLLAGAAA